MTITWLAVSSQVPGVEDQGKKLINILKDRSSFHQEYLVSSVCVLGGVEEKGLGTKASRM